ncbi:MAG: pseudouridine synthase [Bacteroidota bacterium]
MSKKKEDSSVGMRLNKFIAHSGVCSRRQAAELVKTGKIKVNGTVLKEPGYQLEAGDRVEYKGKVLAIEGKKVYLLMNKPKNTITTLKDEKGRRTVHDLIKSKVEERVYPVGRLDRNTLGLLVLTNDGDLAQRLAHPSYEIQKYYEVTLDKVVTEKHIEQIKAGLELEDGPTPVDAVHFLDEKDKTQVGIKIHIGRNRIVRRIFEHLGYQVKRLDRTYYAGLTKKDLPRGWFRHLTEQEVIMLKHFI